jgi:hypothetical protein
MKCATGTSDSRDILSNPLLAFVLFWVPAIAIVATGNAKVGAGWRTGVWAAALSIMGATCIANAARCGRVHCYITGPFFLAMALVTLLYGLGALSLGEHGWDWIGLTILAGAVVLCCLPEFFLGRYRQHRAKGIDHC